MRYLGLVILTATLATACGANTSAPVSPSAIRTPSVLSAAGTWSGTSTDTTGSAQLSWTVTQNGTDMTGTMSVGNTGRSMMGTGTMRGTVNGQALTFHMDVPSGGFSGMMSACSMGVDGQGTMSADGHTLTGTYSGSLVGMMTAGMMNQSCGGAMNNGQFTMTR